MPSVAASDEERIDGVPLVTEAFVRTIRLVATGRLRESVLKALADDDKELAELAEIEGATSTRLIAEEQGREGVAPNEFLFGVPHARFVNASFAYAKPRELNRFNGPGRGAWYCALELATALSEVEFHLAEFLTRSDLKHATVEYSEMFASLAGRFADLRGAPDHPALSRDTASGYPAGNALADQVRAKGLNGIIFPSVRHAGGTCIAALWPHAVQSVMQGAVWRLTWNGEGFEVAG